MPYGLVLRDRVRRIGSCLRRPHRVEHLVPVHTSYTDTASRQTHKQTDKHQGMHWHREIHLNFDTVQLSILFLCTPHTQTRRADKRTNKQTNTKACTDTEKYTWTSTQCWASCSCTHLIHKHMCTGTPEDKYMDMNTKSCTISTPNRSPCCICSSF